MRTGRLSALGGLIGGLGTGARRRGGLATGGGRAALRRFVPYLIRHRRAGLIGAGLIGLAAAAGLASPLALRYIVDEAIPGRDTGVLAAALAVLGGCLAIERLLRVAQEICFARFERRVLAEFQEDLVEHVLRLPRVFFDDRQTGYLTRRLAEDVEGLRFLVSGALVNTAGQALRLAGGIGFVLWLEWRLAAAVLGLLPLLAAGLAYFSRRAHRLSHARLESQAEAAGRIQESLADVAAVKSHAAEKRVRERIVAALGVSFGLAYEQSRLGALCGALIHSIPGIGRLIALAAGAVLVIRAEWTLGSLLAFQAYLVHVFGPAQFLAAANQQLQRARAALERVAALFETVPEEENPGGLRPERLAGDIELRRISFAYAGSAPVLQDVSIRVRPGEAVAIGGASGVGKTTLLSLLLGFYKPSAGEIRFDGRPAADYNLKALRRRIGYVPQTPRLSSGSILENLRFGNPEASLEEVSAAARLAGIHEEVLSFPEGYLTEVGEGGSGLSAGQKQRLALARALVSDPDILILDEPTSALDEGAERSILENLAAWRRGRTLILVTHRESAVAFGDRRIGLQGHRVAVRENQTPADRAEKRLRTGGGVARASRG
jgi:ABC-type bacteriocin/lantibiotic exporter with double-glycine peptidase domain